MCSLSFFYDSCVDMKRWKDKDKEKERERERERERKCVNESYLSMPHVSIYKIFLHLFIYLTYWSNFLLKYMIWVCILMIHFLLVLLLLLLLLFFFKCMTDQYSILFWLFYSYTYTYLFVYFCQVCQGSIFEFI